VIICCSLLYVLYGGCTGCDGLLELTVLAQDGGRNGCDDLL
jgi:hypothetical protein